MNPQLLARLFHVKRRKRAGSGRAAVPRQAEQAQVGTVPVSYGAVGESADERNKAHHEATTNRRH